MRAKFFPIRTHLDWHIMYFYFFLLLNNVFLAELSHTKRACGAPWVSRSTHPRKFGKHVTDRLSDRLSTPQANQCLLSHFLATLKAQEKADCTSMLSSIDKTAYPLTSITWPFRGLRCRPIKVEYFFGSYPLTIYSFSNDRRLTFTFF